ncbi:MAG TPA: glutamine synthetase, partial [Thalassospira lucentensis]|nr:glutamine synthetase [Thalassospira lucentensis]
MSEAEAFLAKYPGVEAIDIILTDFHGIGRGKTIRRHELESIYKSGRGLPSSIFGQDVTGEDVDDCGLVQTGGGGDGRCWPVPGTLGYLPHTGRGQLLISMYDEDRTPHDVDPRNV